MESLPNFVPINPSSRESARLSWNQQYFDVFSSLLLEGKPASKEEVLASLTALPLLIRLTPFRASLRAQMLSVMGAGSHDTGQVRAEVAKAYAVHVKVDVRSGKVAEIVEVREQDLIVTDKLRPENPTQNDRVELAPPALESLSKSLESYLNATLLPLVQEVFTGFVPDLSAAWKARPLGEFKPDVLVPFQALFPNSPPIEREVEGIPYVLDDLYCTRPGCPCTDVTCVVLKRDPKVGQEVAWGGFKYDVMTKKMKPLPNFPNKFNTAEWFKQFGKEFPFALDFTLKSRFDFMRQEFVRQRVLR